METVHAINNEMTTLKTYPAKNLPARDSLSSPPCSIFVPPKELTQKILKYWGDERIQDLSSRLQDCGLKLKPWGGSTATPSRQKQVRSPPLPPSLRFPVNLCGRRAPGDLTFNSTAVICSVARLENLTQGCDVCRAVCTSLWFHVVFIIWGFFCLFVCLVLSFSYQ